MNYPWSREAACRGVDPNIFYPMRGEPVDCAALLLCAACPVQEQCLDHALKHEDEGYWAGTSAKARRRIRRERGISYSKIVIPELVPCGTVTAYNRHRRNGTPTCAACRAANTAEMVRNRDRRRALA